ncbi:MAG: hypothetical protein KA165_05555 [Saprospiraceae bacterium]|nr:hypothetical protein [Saprospiraceae bacterium]
MKFYGSIFVFAAALFISGSCNKVNDQAPGFDMIYQQEFYIPAGIGVFDVHHFQIENIPTRFQQYLDQHGKKIEDITGIITAQASVGGVFGDVDLSFVDQVSVRIYDNTDPTDWVEIAYRQPVPLDPGNSLPLIPSLADAKRFMSDSRFSIDVVFWLRNTTQQESQVRLDLQLKATY